MLHLTHKEMLKIFKTYRSFKRQKGSNYAGNAAQSWK